MTSRVIGLWSAGTALLLALALAGIAYGSTPLPIAQVAHALAGAVGLGPEASGPVARIVLDLRLPRVLLAICVGAGLAVVGALLQTTTRNDLADPFLFGLSSGAAAGASSPCSGIGSASGRCRSPPLPARFSRPPRFWRFWRAKAARRRSGW